MPEAALKRFAIIGDPVDHSLSPAIHNEFFRRHGLEARYEPLPTRTEKLWGTLSRVDGQRLSGLNVTFPFKKAVLSHLSAVDETALKLQAVNTLVPVDVATEGRVAFKGFNTDGDGLCSYLEGELGAQWPGSRVLILGAGGTARFSITAPTRPP